MIDLGEFLGVAADINNLGQVVGGAGGNAILYSDGQVTDLGSLGGSSSAKAINDVGQVVGSSEISPDGLRHAFLYSDGVLIDLGTLGGLISDARDINDAGQVVGDSYLSGSGYCHAFLYTDGVMIDLGTLGGLLTTVAHGINNHGQVVGTASHSRAFLWENGEMFDLNDFIPEDSGWEKLTEATDINDAGQVVGWGKLIDGEPFHKRAFLLTPVDPCADDDADGEVTICHVPPGNPAKAHTITVSVNAVPAHLRHGDECGACEDDGGLFLTAGAREACSADVNGDSTVNAADLALLLGMIWMVKTVYCTMT